MKFNKKKVFVAALTVCLVAILSMGTLAWFTDSDSVTNKFMVATSTEKPDDIFSVDVWERVDTNDDGVFDATLKENGHTYENIVPGDKLAKEPFVINTGSYSEWVRVKVTINNANDWAAILNKHNITDLSTIFMGHDESIWERYDNYTVEDDKATYVFYLKTPLAPSERATVFTHVAIPEVLDRDDAAMFANGSFEVTVVAEAIQSEHTGNSAKEAFAANWQ